MHSALPHQALSADSYCDQLDALPDTARHMEINGADIHVARFPDGSTKMLIANDGYYALAVVKD